MALSGFKSLTLKEVKDQHKLIVKGFEMERLMMKRLAYWRVLKQLQTRAYELENNHLLIHQPTKRSLI